MKESDRDPTLSIYYVPQYGKEIEENMLLNEIKWKVDYTYLSK